MANPKIEQSHGKYMQQWSYISKLSTKREGKYKKRLSPFDQIYTQSFIEILVLIQISRQRHEKQDR